MISPSAKVCPHCNYNGRRANGRLYGPTNDPYVDSDVSYTGSNDPSEPRDEEKSQDPEWFHIAIDGKLLLHGVLYIFCWVFIHWQILFNDALQKCEESVRTGGDPYSDSAP